PQVGPDQIAPAPLGPRRRPPPMARAQRHNLRPPLHPARRPDRQPHRQPHLVNSHLILLLCDCFPRRRRPSSRLGSRLSGRHPQISEIPCAAKSSASIPCPATASSAATTASAILSSARPAAASCASATGW